ncbi:peptidylprolyl isomerase [Wenzhouxiangella sp. AB-CW3]|uniref:peptidylprolyl isomerase n=1 Tax=Wenzhouxiangella sp. AB-CW3 TaxID=2771012 RepID=UPI00168A4090|nr:peptidylprolyl isomerase [Wenzhouxiangella sp. AB-CW3]QOC22928.1 peptidylprolyl isomerase [Wenzhouxiangella sp. AB-CW3]
MKLATIRTIPLLAMGLALISVGHAEEREVDRIVAVVEEDVILKSELDDAITHLERQVQARGESLPPRSVVEEQMLERLIMNRLEVLRAESTGIRVSDSDVDQALNHVAQNNGMTIEQLRMALESDGIEFSEFREEIRQEMLSSRLRQRVAQSMDDITETEIDMLLASDRLGGREYLLSQIVINVPEAASPAEVSEAEGRAEEVLGQLRGGMDFAAAAITYSQGAEALEGGDLGWRNLNALPPMFADEIEGQEPGTIAGPIRTPAGFVILQVRDTRDHSQVIVREYRARHIMVEPTELVSPEQAEQRIRDLHERIADGEDFAELARSYSTDETSANLGGLLNWFPTGQYGSSIQQMLDRMEPGEVSEPFRSQSGWHIVKFEDVREADRTADAMRSQAREMLFEQRAEEEVERFLRQMRGESYVDVRL